MKVNVTGKMKQIVTATKHANNILQTYKIIHVLRFLVMPLFKWERALITIIKTRKGAIDFKAVKNKIIYGYGYQSITCISRRKLYWYLILGDCFRYLLRVL